MLDDVLMAHVRVAFAERGATYDAPRVHRALRAVSWAGQVTKVPSGRKPPSVRSRCRTAAGGPHRDQRLLVDGFHARSTARRPELSSLPARGKVRIPAARAPTRSVPASAFDVEHKILSEERKHMILHSVRHRTHVVARILLEAVSNAVGVEHAMEFGGVDP